MIKTLETKTLSVPALCTLVEEALTTIGGMDYRDIDTKAILNFVSKNTPDLERADATVMNALKALVEFK